MNNQNTNTMKNQPTIKTWIPMQNPNGSHIEAISTRKWIQSFNCLILEVDEKPNPYQPDVLLSGSYDNLIKLLTDSEYGFST